MTVRSTIDWHDLPRSASGPAITATPQFGTRELAGREETPYGEKCQAMRVHRRIAVVIAGALLAAGAYYSFTGTVGTNSFAGTVGVVAHPRADPSARLGSGNVRQVPVHCPSCWHPAIRARFAPFIRLSGAAGTHGCGTLPALGRIWP